MEKIFQKNRCGYSFGSTADIVPSINNPTKYFNVNVKGTLNILENSREYKVKKIIYMHHHHLTGYQKNIQQTNLKSSMTSVSVCFN